MGDEPWDLGGRQLRIGVDKIYNSDGVDPELFASVEEAARTLAAATKGEIVPCSMLTPSEITEYLSAWGPVCTSEALHAHTAAGTWPARREEYGTWLRSWLEQGETVTGMQYAGARIMRDQLVGRIEAMFVESGIDVL